MIKIVSHCLEHATVHWDESGQPISDQYDDVYFSKNSGLEESRYVFLEGNQLEKRWQRTSTSKKSDFIILEMGFGTGLNFLAAWELWRKIQDEQESSSKPHLHFISIENSPLSLFDLEKTCRLWPQLSGFSKQLLEHYPKSAIRGFHRLEFQDNQVSLTLIFDEASSALSQLKSSSHPNFTHSNFEGVDAWFLDGFSPAKNPEIWQNGVLQGLSELSCPKATMATYSAAGAVRRTLQAVGFEVSKQPGFAHKREMLTGVLHRDNIQPKSTNENRFTSQHPIPWNVFYPSKSTKKSALIIGGGLSGCHTASALAKRGWDITVIEKNVKVAEEASGNPQGILYTKLSADSDGLSQFNLSALLYSQRLYKSLVSENPILGELCGTLHLAWNKKEEKIQEQLQKAFSGSQELVQFISSETASKIAGETIPHMATYIADSGWLNPNKICQYLVSSKSIDVLLNQPVNQLVRDEYGWHAVDHSGNSIATADVAIITNAAAATIFSQAENLPLKPLRGQISVLTKSQCLASLKSAVCGHGYVAPVNCSDESKLQTFGATFTLNNHSADTCEKDHLENISLLSQLLPKQNHHIQSLEPHSLAGRTGFRCTTPDYLPLVGPVANQEKFLHDYQALAKNSNANISTAGTYHKNLFINVGHGSRGLAYTPLSAEIIASQVSGTPLPVSQLLATALNPARFLIRDIIRGRIPLPKTN